MKNNQYDKIGPAGRSLSGETSRSNARPLPRSDEKCSSPVTGTSVAKSIPAATYNGAPRPSCSAPPFAQASVIQPAENDNMEQSKIPASGRDAFHSVTISQSTINHPQSTVFSLRKDFGVWQLTCAGKTAILKHEVGLDYVAFLMAHPGEQFHGLALALKVRAIREGAPEREDLIQERALALDDAEASRRLYRKQRELEALIDDEHTIEAVRDEAYEQLRDILVYQKTSLSKTKTQAYKASHAVAMAIKRLQVRLAKAVDDCGRPHRILRLFGRFIMHHILLPSGRALPGGTRPLNSGGYFTFEPGATQVRTPLIGRIAYPHS